jgi:hypothetical protein
MAQGTNLTIENRRAGGMASGNSRRLNTAVSMLISLPPITDEDREKLQRAVDAIPAFQMPKEEQTVVAAPTDSHGKIK